MRMLPPDTPPRPSHVNTTCTDCGAALIDNRWRCRACIRAAKLAILAAGPGQVVRPSDVLRERENDAL